LEDGVLVHVDAAFHDETAVADALLCACGPSLSYHQDERGIFVLPETSNVRATRYEDVISQAGEVGYFMNSGQVEEGEGLGSSLQEEHLAEEFDAGSVEYATLASVLGSIQANSAALAVASRMLPELGPELVREMLRAMQSCDAARLSELRERVERAVGGREALEAAAASLLGGLSAPQSEQADSHPNEVLDLQSCATADKAGQ
jgi:hypothetical protein